MDKKWPVALTLLHSLLSGISSYKIWPLKVFSGLEIESSLVAIIAAAIGTILELLKVVKRKHILTIDFFGLIFVLTILKYSFILSQTGSTPSQI